MKLTAFILSTSIAMTVSTIASAQTKDLSLEQLIPGNENFLYPQSLYNVAWEGKTLCYSTKDSVYSVSLNGKQLSAMSLEEADSINSLKGEKKITNGEVSADKIWSAVNRGNKLFVVHNEDCTELEVSDDAPGDIVWGQSVHRNEFGIDGGIFWAPTGHKLAFYRMDQSMVKDYPLVNTDAREAEVTPVKYPMAGMTSHQVTLGVFNPETKQTVYMKTAGPDDHYLTCITWRPDGSQIFIAELNRDQNHMDLNVYDAQTGAFIETLFSETNEKYVEPEHPLFFLPGSNDKFIWQSERDGFNHLYLYDLSKKSADGKQLAKAKQLTQGQWLVTDLLGADTKGKTLYFMSTEASPIESQLYSVEVSNGKMRRLTQEEGVHHVIFNESYTAIYDVYSNHDTPLKSQIVNLKSGKRTPLFSATNPYDGYNMPDITVGTLKAADGVTDLYYRLVKPTHFENGKKYPTVVYLYNGPHAQMIVDGWNYDTRGWDIHMANLGYVVFTIDGRGSENRGLAFEQTIWHNLGENEGKDQMCGIDYLKSLAFVDAERIGIHGWSYGGFMTTYMMLNYPETFKVGVAGGPVLDWSRYEVMYGERYMGTPQNNPEGYKRNCLLEQAGKLKGHLLLIHDDQDDTVVPQHSMQFLKNAIQNNTYPDFFMYPGHKHNVRGTERVHLHEKITRYFEDYLKK